MKKTKLQKGITLIALIITIVVLMILAVVTIGVVQEDKIIKHAQNAASGYNEAKLNEIDALAGYEQLIDENNPNVKKVDYNNIAQILNKQMNEEITYEEAVNQLKQEFKIVDENVTDVSDMGIATLSNNYYFYDIDALYGIDSNTNTFVYIKEEENEEQYNFGRNVKDIKEELERIFIGKVTSEIIEKYNVGTLDEHVLDSSDKITAISFSSNSDEEIIRLSSVTLGSGENEMTIDTNYYSVWIYSKEGIYYKVGISLGA